MKITPMVLFIVFLLAIESYSFFALKASVFMARQGLFTAIYLLTTLFVFFGVLVMIRTFSHLPINQSAAMNIFIGVVFSFIVAKLHFSAMFFVEDMLRGFLWLFQSAFNFRIAEFISRSYIWGVFIFGSGSLLFFLLNYGVVWGKYHYKVHRETLWFEHLPESFDGFKIGQLSDMHLGTFDNLEKVEKGLELLRRQGPDVIVFTGDMVNNRADEALKYVDAVEKLSAPYGKFTILGNHDYGDYMRWNSLSDKDDNLAKLYNVEELMGLEWLRNEYRALVKGNDTIYLAGVDNWGLPPFPQYGDLQKATHGIPERGFVVLLSHDPTHWREVVQGNIPRVSLTLSGHTHGMQFGIEIGEMRWSPVKYKYKEWAGLYNKAQQYLYVNRGFGNIGYPGRLGIRPEIAVIELRRKNNRGTHKKP